MINLLKGVAVNTTGSTYRLQATLVGPRTGLAQASFGAGGQGDVTFQGRMSADHDWVDIKAFIHTDTVLADEISLFPEMRAVFANAAGTPTVYASISGAGMPA